MNELRHTLTPVYHGIAMGVLALIFGALWAAYLATHHETLHGGFEAAENKAKQVEIQVDMGMTDMNMESAGHSHAAGASASHQQTDVAPSSAAGHGEHAHSGGAGHEAGAQHSHTGSLATDAMQRLLRGHIHFMGIGLLVMIVLVFAASTSLKDGWKKVFGWTFGLGALMYPPAWILMGFRTVELGPEGAEASVMWLFGPAVGLLIGSLIALFLVILLESSGLKKAGLFSWAFNQEA